MKINNLLEGITAASSPENAESPAPKFGRSDKFLEEKDEKKVEECTTSGSIASVASPVGGMQRRGKGSIFSGIKTSDKYPNSKAVKESFNRAGYNPLRDKEDYLDKREHLHNQLNTPGLSKEDRDVIRQAILDLEFAARKAGLAEEQSAKFQMPNVGSWLNVGQQDQETDDTPGNFSIVVAGRQGKDFQAITLAKALETILPKDYPRSGWPNTPGSENSPTHHVIQEVLKRGQAVIKDGIASKDIATSIAVKFKQYGIPAYVEGMMEEAKKANTKTARKAFGKRVKAKLSDKEEEKKQSESDRLWAMLQQHIADTEKEVKEGTMDYSIDPSITDFASVSIIKKLKRDVHEKRLPADPREIMRAGAELARYHNTELNLPLLAQQVLSGYSQGVAEDQLDEKSVSKAQFRTMAAVAHNPKFAKKVGIKQSVGKEFHKADKDVDYKSLPAKVDEGHYDEEECDLCNGTGEGLYDGESCHKCHGTGILPGTRDDDDFDIPDDDYGDDYGDDESYYEKYVRTRNLEEEEKQRLDPKCWTGYRKQGTKMKGGVRVNNCVKVDEAELAEEMLAQQLYRDLQIFKKGDDKGIANRPKDKEIGNKPKDKDIVTKESANPAQQAAIAIAKKKEQGVKEDWQKTNKQDKTDGMSPKAVKAYRRENPGSKLQTAVTTKPSKLKAGSKDAKRRKSFCARMSGNPGPMKDEKGRPTPKAKALRRWNCE